MPTKPLYRAEHAGSLLRPIELLEARDTGLDIFSDGGMRRGSWPTDMADTVEGFVRERVVLDWKAPGGGPEASTANAAAAPMPVDSPTPSLPT